MLSLGALLAIFCDSFSLFVVDFVIFILFLEQYCCCINLKFDNIHSPILWTSLAVRCWIYAMSTNFLSKCFLSRLGSKVGEESTLSHTGSLHIFLKLDKDYSKTSRSPAYIFLFIRTMFIRGSDSYILKNMLRT